MEFVSKIIDIKRETWDTVTVKIKADNFSFKAGQFVTLTLKIDGNEVKRAYSIATSPSDKGYFEITSKKYGVFSTYLDEKAKVGEKIKVNGPHGLFTYEERCNKIIAIAAGSGIAPIRGIVRQAIEEKKEIELLYSVKTDKDIIYEKELELLKNNKNFKSKVVLTGNGGKRIDLNFLKENLKFDDKSLFYICGPPAFVKAMVEDLKELKIKEDKIKTERFG